MNQLRSILAVIFFSFLFWGAYAQDVGIGTSAPLMKLHIANEDSAALILENTRVLNTNVKSSLFFMTGAGSKPYTGGIKTIGDDTATARLGFFTSASSIPNGLEERLSILDNGNVGINTTTPSGKLSVAGNADFSGSVGIGILTPSASAIVELSSTSQGFLPPRMSAGQRAAIASPVAGLLVYQTDDPSGYYYYADTSWVSVESAGSGANSSAACIDYDGNAYPTITIDNQVWMAENLRVTHYRNGDNIFNILDPAGWITLTYGAYCWYDNDMATYRKYGALYNWYTVDDSRGVCPQGWRVPTDADWTALITNLGGMAYAGGKMKSVSAFWDSPNVDATNNSGFSALPGGARDDVSGTFANIGISGYWWASTQSDSSTAWGRYLYHYNPQVYRNNIGKAFGLSVRCIRDY